MRKGQKNTSETIEKMRLAKMGHKVSVETRKKISLAQIGKRLGKENHKWKGDKVGYLALHSWVQRELGKPDTCEHCGKSGLKGRQIGWANKDHLYKRNLKDWIRLCTSCHRRYDYANGLSWRGPNNQHL